jgi:hypothetical protein
VPIVPARLRASGWAARMHRAAGFAVGDLDTIVVALAGFLVRGGIVLLAAPAAVMPSVLGLASVFGVNAFGIDGRPTTWFISVVILGVVAIGLWLLIACLLGSLLDVWVIHAAIEWDPRAIRRPRPLPSFGLLLDMASVRAVCLIPLGASLVWAVSQIYDAAFAELTLPRDLATPLLVRIAIRGAPVLTVVAVTWLSTETVAAIAVRHMLIGGVGFWQSLAGAVEQIGRRPLSTLATVVISTATSVVAVGIAVTGMATAFDWCLAAARMQSPIVIQIGLGPLSTTRDFRPAVFLGTTLVLALAWVVGLALSGIMSAWRSAAITAETAAVLAGTGELMYTEQKPPAASPEATPQRQTPGP